MPVRFVVMATVVSVIVVMVMSVVMMRPGRKRIDELFPALGARGDLRVGQETGVELASQRLWIDVDPREGNCLPAIAERFPPLTPGPFRHLEFASMIVARCPPVAGRSVVRLSARQVKSTCMIHPGGEPEESLSAKDSG